MPKDSIGPAPRTGALHGTEPSAAARHAMVRYTMDFFPEIKNRMGDNLFDFLLHRLKIIMTDGFEADERIVTMRPDGYEAFVRFPGKKELDDRIGSWAHRFGEVLAGLRMPYGVSLSAGVCEVEEAADLSRPGEYSEKAAFAQVYGQLGSNPFVRYFSADDYQAFRRRRYLETQIPDAVREHQLQIYLQPQYALADRKIVGAEVLLRWNHPDLGFLLPNDFIPLLESDHFIIPIDFYVLEECCKILRRWHAENFRCVPLSVNFSRLHASTDDFVPRFLSVTEKYGILPGELQLEWTESAFSDQDVKVCRIAEQMRSRGYKIAMDDFGSGYSSLNALTSLPVDIVKWDKKFMDFPEGDRQRRYFLKQMMQVADKLRYTVIAEGVESAWQARLLQKIGCKYVQGFLYSRPVPPAACEKMILTDAKASKRKRKKADAK